MQNVSRGKFVPLVPTNLRAIFVCRCTCRSTLVRNCALKTKSLGFVSDAVYWKQSVQRRHITVALTSCFNKQPGSMQTAVDHSKTLSTLFYRLRIFILYLTRSLFSGPPSLANLLRFDCRSRFSLCWRMTFMQSWFICMKIAIHSTFDLVAASQYKQLTTSVTIVTITLEFLAFW